MDFEFWELVDRVALIATSLTGSLNTSEAQE